MFKKTADTELHLLDNPQVIRWCYEPFTAISLRDTSNEKKLVGAKKEEKAWGNSVIGATGSSQWTTRLCQEVVREALIRLGRENVRKLTQIQSSVRKKKYDPDLESNEYVYEVKGRGWCTPGTAGEKILGVPLKYGELPTLFRKPLRIVLVGYQEYEAKEGFAFGNLFNSSTQTKELQDGLRYFKDHKIEYVAFTDILKEIGLPFGSWKK